MAHDLPALLLIYTSTGDRAGLQALSETAGTSFPSHSGGLRCADSRVRNVASTGSTNIAFACALQLGDSTACIDLLLATNRAPEAALFLRTFAPSQMPRTVGAWRKSLEAAKKPKQAAAIANPVERPEEFAEGWAAALQREQDLLAGQPVN